MYMYIYPSTCRVLLMATDTFICGSCSTEFHDLVAFLEHKRSTSCGVTLQYNSASADDNNVTVLAEAPLCDPGRS